jgi:hypothetical protein
MQHNLFQDRVAKRLCDEGFLKTKELFTVTYVYKTYNKNVAIV